MHLSRVLIDHLDRGTWRVLADRGETHRFVMRAFPADSQDRVLYRVEPELVGSRSAVLVQSGTEPDWSFLREVSGRATASSKRVEFEVAPDMPYRFRLRANPTVKRDGKRFGYLREEEVRSWFRRKGELLGFSAADERVAVRPEGALRIRRRDGSSATFQSYLLEGALVATDPSALVRAVERGVGSGKAFGFGLISLAPLRGR